MQFKEAKLLFKKPFFIITKTVVYISSEGKINLRFSILVHQLPICQIYLKQKEIKNVVQFLNIGWPYPNYGAEIRMPY